MSYSSSLPRALSRSLRPYLRTTPYHTALLWSSWHVGVQAPRPSTLPIRSLSISSYRRNGVPAGATTQFASPTDLTPEQYHKLADQYIDDLVAELEEIQEEREEVDVEYSAGVLSLKFPPHGTYVLNKQPANKQIWLSSPVSGPKRYDYVAGVASTEANAGAMGPEGGPVALASQGNTESTAGLEVGDWIYLRDGSSLSELLREELKVTLNEVE